MENKMNERIKQLAEQAKIEFTYDPTEKPIRAFAECWEDELEKFAELIVQECSAVANHFSDGHEKDQFGRKMFLYTADIGQVILEHFGVEE
jgi:hypothetical protein